MMKRVRLEPVEEEEQHCQLKKSRSEESLELLRAKKALHHSHPDILLCREEQLSLLNNFIHTHLKDHTPGSLYISGPPGTGKTVCLSHSLKRVKSVASINCMTVTSPQLYSRIGLELLGRKGKSLHMRDQLEAYITTTENMIVIVLDEMDQLNQQVLYTLFEWPALKGSKLILIGVANTLDLIDRLLPRLQSQFQPTVVRFPPYKKQEIATILIDRLRQEDTIFSPEALQFCAAKVSGINGDLRNALDICRRALEMVERTKSENSLSDSLRSHRVTVRHICTVISEVYASSQTDSLPLQQKIAACTLLCLVKDGNTKEPTLGKLYDAYLKVCYQKKLRCESETEFMGVVSMLEARGFVSIKKSKQAPRLGKVWLKLDEKELTHALHDKVLMGSILEQGLTQ